MLAAINGASQVICLAVRVLIQPGGGVRLRKDVRRSRGVKGKAEKCGQGGEGVQNPEIFADVLYVWSLITLIQVTFHFFISKLHFGSGNEHIKMFSTNVSFDNCAMKPT